MSDPKAQLAFEILVRENSRMLTAYLRSLVNNDAAVDDLFQEVMVVAWKRLDECDLSRPFGPWFRGIAARVVMAYYRKRKASPLFLNEAVLTQLDHQFESIASVGGDTWNEKVAALQDCIGALSDSHRAVINGRYFDDMKSQSLASHLGISLEACKKRLQRGRALLAQCLKRKGILIPVEAAS